jgi:hypothetical protein
MIDLMARYNDRWSVREVFQRGNCRNFQFFLVEDEQVQGRDALLKTVRKTDMPAEDLYRWRQTALAAEAARAGTLAHPAMPEPLDTFALPDGEPALVSAPVGQGGGSLLLRDKVQRYGFIDSRERRQVDQIARYLAEVLAFTEQLWDLGFVHGNLNPDHLYILRDGVLRVTGTSAVCRREGGAYPQRGTGHSQHVHRPPKPGAP